MSFTRRKFILLTTAVCSGCVLPRLVSGGFESVGTFSDPDSAASHLLDKTITGIQKLPTARACLICGYSIETIGGQKLIHTTLRGTELVGKSDYHFRENLRGRIRLFEDHELTLIAWGEKQFMTEQIIERAKITYLQGEQPWFCQKCGFRTCHLCGTPLIWLAYGDYAFDDSGRGYYLKGANLGASPPCVNSKCENYRAPGGESVDSEEISS
jgi:hypothetical protein